MVVVPAVATLFYVKVLSKNCQHYLDLDFGIMSYSSCRISRFLHFSVISYNYFSIVVILVVMNELVYTSQRLILAVKVS